MQQRPPFDSQPINQVAIRPRLTGKLPNYTDKGTKRENRKPRVSGITSAEMGGMGMGM